MKQELIAFALPTHMPGHGGWGNGYVAIPEGHPAYGLDYDNDIFDGILVSGGLTFADKANSRHPKETQGMWVVGFDTLHYGDDMQRWPNEASVMKEANSLKSQLEELKH